MATTGSTTISVDLSTITTTIVDNRLLLTFSDILEMFNDRGVDVTNVTSVDLHIKNSNGSQVKSLSSDNEIEFRIKKTTTTEAQPIT